MIISNFFDSITPDGWISFAGSIIGAFFTLVSVIIVILIERKHNIQNIKNSKRIYHNRLLESLPSIDQLCSQADYLNDEDGLLGGFTSSESRVNILVNKMNDDLCTDERRAHFKYKIERHKEYLKYWEKANIKIEEFMNDGYFNVIKSECDGAVIAAYYDFIVAFHNEHNYCGPVITTDDLRNLLVKLVEEIHR